MWSVQRLRWLACSQSVVDWNNVVRCTAERRRMEYDDLAIVPAERGGRERCFLLRNRRRRWTRNVNRLTPVIWLKALFSDGRSVLPSQCDLRPFVDEGVARAGARPLRESRFIFNDGRAFGAHARPEVQHFCVEFVVVVVVGGGGGPPRRRRRTKVNIDES